MMNQEHVDLLKQGVEQWNRWRRGHPEIWLDLRWTDLQKAKLSRPDLNGTELSGADLSEGTLRG